MIKINDRITIHTEKVEGSLHVDQLTNEQLKELVNWQNGDKYVYPSPKIKLESLCASKLVYLKRPAANSDEAQNRFIKEPYITVKNKENDDKGITTN